MKTAIQGKEIETTYSVKAVRNEKGVLTKKPELVKESKVVKWDNLFDPIDGKIEYNTLHLFEPYHYINISEDEKVKVDEQIYRADINALILHTNKVVSEKEINKTESEKEFKKVMAEYNHLIVDNNSKMKAYCNVNKIDIDTVDIDDLKKIFEDKCNTHSGIAITSDIGSEFAFNSTGSALVTFRN
jgi:hypothetical protein